MNLYGKCVYIIYVSTYHHPAARIYAEDHNLHTFNILRVYKV